MWPIMWVFIFTDVGDTKVCCWQFQHIGDILIGYQVTVTHIKICHNVMLVTDLLCWRHEIYLGTKFKYFYCLWWWCKLSPTSQTCHQHTIPHTVTKYFIFNIRYQHLCNHYDSSCCSVIGVIEEIRWCTVTCFDAETLIIKRNIILWILHVLVLINTQTSCVYGVW